MTELRFGTAVKLYYDAVQMPVPSQLTGGFRLCLFQRSKAMGRQSGMPNTMTGCLRSKP